MTIANREPAGGRAWPARVSGGLLLMQGTAILLYFWYLLRSIDLEASLVAGAPTLVTVDLFSAAFFFGGPALLAVLSSVGLLLRRRSAWLFAMMAEGLLLASGLYFHFYLNTSSYSRSLPTYLVMASAIVMVFYLNSADVRLAFASGGSGSSSWRQRSGEAIDHGL